MKTLLLVTTSFVLAASAALAQGDACSKKYGSCMDHCSSRPQSVQGSCAQTCEANTNDCYTGMYGRPPADGGGQATIAEPSRDAQGSAAPAADGK